MERIIPWGEWVKIVKPCYYKGERRNKPYDLELMLRLYVLENLYSLSDEATVAEVIDSRAFSDFCGVESSNQVPNGDTLGQFRNLLTHNGVQEKLFAQVVELLQERGLLLKKGNTWYFGYKAHIGVDKDSGLVHTIKGTSANVHDVTMVPELLTGEETATVDIWVPKSGEKPFLSTLMVIESTIKSTAVPLKVNMLPHALRRR